MGFKDEECPPDPERAIEGFRDTGYNLKTAVADIVDNSINAKAENIWIDLAKDAAGRLFLRIADDGYGMSKDELHAAMRYGAPERKVGNALGRFGLGLKTASSAICRRFTVTSMNKVGGVAHAACWDLDHVAERKAWMLQVGEAPEALSKQLLQKLKKGPGTLVSWDKIDRFGEDGEVTAQALSANERYLREHLELVFHRFLEKKGFAMYLNGIKLKPWNPFMPDEDTKRHDVGNIKIKADGKTHEVGVIGYVLPNKYEFSTEEAKNRAKLKNTLQGFYVYRENRVIISGGWLDMFIQEPHTTLCRIELSFPRELDPIFKLDIKKSHLDLRHELVEHIQKLVEPVRAEAQQRYRSGSRTAVDGKKGAHDFSQKLIDDKYGATTESVGARQTAPGKVEITNPFGKLVIEMPTVTTPKREDVIELVPSLEEGLFWEPALVNGRIGVRINTNHIYYKRVYMPNLLDAVTVQGIDSILWAFSKSEQEVIDKESKGRYRKMRVLISLTLRELAEGLPDPDND